MMVIGCCMTDLPLQIITLGALTATTVINPSLHGPRWKTLRLSTFIATGFSAFAPILHGVSIFGHEQLDKQTGLRYYYLEGILILIGVGFYAVRLACSSIRLLPQDRTFVDWYDRLTSQNRGDRRDTISGVHHISCFTYLLFSALWHIGTV